MKKTKKSKGLSNTVIDLLWQINTLSSDLYQCVQEWIQEYSKLINYSLKFLNHPQAYHRDNGTVGHGPMKDNQKTVYINFNMNTAEGDDKICSERKEDIEDYDTSEIFLKILPDKDILNNDIKVIRQEYQALLTSN